MGRFVIALAIALTSGTAALADGYRLLKLDGFLVKWGSPGLGISASVTYSFVETRHSFPEAINCQVLDPLAPELVRLGVSWTVLRDEFRRAFRMWERAANIVFDYVEDPALADILIGASGTRRGAAYANVWLDQDKRLPISSISKAAICLNPTVPWEAGFDGEADTFDIRYVAAHEIGHAIGLNHPGRTGQLMGFSYSEGERGLRYGDIEGARLLYGPPRQGQRSESLSLPEMRPGPRNDALRRGKGRIGSDHLVESPE